jgi:hypothetical protein
VEKHISIKKIRIFIIVIFLPIIIYVAIKDTIEGNKYALALRKEYPQILSSKKISGKIVRNFNRYGASYITLEDSTKYVVSESRNYSYDAVYFDKFIKNGDIIHKNSNSDTVYIRRDNKVYYFILGKFINEE